MPAARIKREIDVEAGQVTFTVLETGKKLVCKIADMPQEMQTRTLLHGLNAVVGDSAADPEKDAISAMTDRWNTIKSGVWAARSGGGGPKLTKTVKVMHRIETKQAKAENREPRSLEDVAAWVSDQKDEDLKAIRQHPDYKRELANLNAEEAKAAADKAKKAGSAETPLKIG